MFPSGEQIEIVSGAQRAVVTSVGATLREYQVDEHPWVDGFAADEVCPSGRGQVLMPWPNRIADGRYEFAGTRHELTIDEPKLGHAIHGLVRWAPWQVEEAAGDLARLRYVLHAQPGYPFDLNLEVEYRVSSSGLAVSMGATNIGSAPCPFGAGSHPYFALPATGADDVELRVRAEEWLDVDARSIPTGHRPVEGSPLDYRKPRRIGTAALDHAFTHLERNGAGVATVLLRHGDDRLDVWFDRTFDFVQVFTGDTLPDRPRRRRSVAVEPMTCAPNAFNSGDGLRVLSPGESMRGSWGVAVSRRGSR